MYLLVSVFGSSSSTSAMLTCSMFFSSSSWTTIRLSSSDSESLTSVTFSLLAPSTVDGLKYHNYTNEEILKLLFLSSLAGIDLVVFYLLLQPIVSWQFVMDPLEGLKHLVLLFYHLFRDLGNLG